MQTLLFPEHPINISGSSVPGSKDKIHWSTNQTDNDEINPEFSSPSNQPFIETRLTPERDVHTVKIKRPAAQQ